MKLEQAMKFLREGKKIFRKSKPDFSLRIEQFGLRSFYVTIYDMIADDWETEFDLFDKEKGNEK